MSRLPLACSFRKPSRPKQVCVSFTEPTAITMRGHSVFSSANGACEMPIAAAGVIVAARQLSQTRLERNIKRRAIACHRTQVALSRRRFFAYANRPETFALAQRHAPIVFDGPIRSARRVGDALHMEVAFTMKPLRAEETA